MRTILIGTTLALAFANGANASVTNDPWVNDYDQARTIARKTGKPMFVVFR